MKRKFIVIGSICPINKYGETLDSPKTIGDYITTTAGEELTQDYECAIAMLANYLTEIKLDFCITTKTVGQKVNGANTIRLVFAATRNNWKTHELFLWTAAYKKSEANGEREENREIEETVDRFGTILYNDALLALPKSVELVMEGDKPKEVRTVWETEKETMQRVTLINMDEKKATVN